MANYYQDDYRAIPEVATFRMEDGNYQSIARLYSYPGPAKVLDKGAFEKPTKAEAQKAAQAWVNKQMKVYKGRK